MKRYPAYKDSGIEWIRDIPRDWKTIKLKYILRNFDRKRIPLSSEERSEMQGDYPYYGSNGIVDRVNNYLFDGEYILLGEDGAPFFELYKDVAFLVKGKFWVNNHAHILKAIQNYDQRFITYSLNCVDYRKYITGSTRDKLTQDDMSTIVLPNTDASDQKSIADYLDRKTVQIDDLIAKKERMIELLKEERTAIINQAVTKGVDPNVEMKDSGIEWLGKIPKHWNLKKIKYLVRVNGMSLSETTDENYEFNYIDISNVDLEEGLNIGEKINFASAPSRARRMVRKGDTICSTVRTYLKAIAHIGEDVKDIIVSTGFAVISPYPNFIPKFIYYVLRSEKFIDRVCALSVGVSYPAINSTELSDIVIWYPESKDEQERIARYLDNMVSKTKIAIKQLQEEIQHLKEYRTALISEVVTGKIDVREGIA